MTINDGKDLVNRINDKHKDLKNRQKIIKNHPEDSKRLENFLLSLSESADHIKNYTTENLAKQFNEKEHTEFYMRIEDTISDIDEWIIKIDERIDNFFKEIYDKIPGYYFGILGLLIFLSSTLIAVFVYLSVNPDYSIFTNWISDLGAGPDGANIIFNTGWVLSSGLILLFHIYQIQNIKKKIEKKYFYLLKFMAISNISFTLGIFLVGIFPEYYPVKHLIAATFYFLGGFLFFSIYGVLGVLNKKIPLSYIFIVTFISIIYILFYITAHFPDTLSKVGITPTSMEWMTLISEASMMLMILFHSLIENYFLKKYDKEREKIITGGFDESKFKNRILKHFEEKYH